MFPKQNGVAIASRWEVILGGNNKYHHRKGAIVEISKAL